MAMNQHLAVPSKWVTVADRFARDGGVGSGFDLMRLVLSAAVLCFHSDLAAYGHSTLNDTALFPFALALVPAFFALSGFLVAGSAARAPSAPIFLAFRALRIMPALATEVCLSALLLGPMLTIVSLREYFTDARFFRYFGNIIGWVKFLLPGLFVNNPWPDIVNINMWTLKPEIGCYLVVAALLASGVFARRVVTTGMFALAVGALALAHALYGISASPGNFPPHVIMVYFGFGVMAFLWRDRIPLHGGLFVASLVLAYLGLTHTALMYVNPFLVTYCVVYLGMSGRPGLRRIGRHDYSYGLYLYGFPIQQALVMWFPALREWWWLLLASLPLTLLCAIVSWHVVERPALRLKKVLIGLPMLMPSRQVALERAAAADAFERERLPS